MSGRQQFDQLRRRLHRASGPSSSRWSTSRSPPGCRTSYATTSSTGMTANHKGGSYASCVDGELPAAHAVPLSWAGSAVFPTCESNAFSSRSYVWGAFIHGSARHRATTAAYSPYASSRRSQSSERVGNAGTACQRSSSGDLADDGDRRRVERLRDLGAGDRGADDDPALLVDDEPRRSRRAAPDERPARVAARLDVDGADGEPGLLRGRERQADGPDLRVGEDHARRGAAVRAQAHVLARGSDPPRAAPGTCPCASAARGR